MCHRHTFHSNVYTQLAHPFRLELEAEDESDCNPHNVKYSSNKVTHDPDSLSFIALITNPIYHVYRKDRLLARKYPAT